MIEKIKIYGLQRSGTTYLEHLIRKNFKVQVFEAPSLELGGKHMMPHEKRYRLNNGVVKKYPEAIIDIIKRQKKFLAIVIEKDCEKWLESIIRKKVDLENKRPNLFFRGKLNESEAIKLHRLFYQSWDREVTKCVLKVNYKSLVQNYDAFLCFLQFKYNLIPLKDKFKNVDKVPQSGRFNEQRRKYYLS